MSIKIKKASRIFFAFSLVITVATRLRFSIIGPGEFLLATWSYLIFLYYISGNKVISINRISTIGISFLTLLCCLFLSVMVNSLAVGTCQGVPLAGAIRTALAITFSISICLLFFSLHSSFYEVCSTLELYIFFMALFFIIISFLSAIIPSLNNFLWYGASRFTGGAKNPNQTALYVVSAPFIVCFLSKNFLWVKRKRTQKIFLMLVIGLIGYLCRSDALYVAWVTAVLAMCFLKLLKSRFIRSKKFLVLIMLIVILISAMWGRIKLVAYDVFDYYLHQERGNSYDYTNVRFILWTNALKAIEDSPFLGWGPGAFSGIDSPFAGEEAHNSILDWGMSTGVLGITFFVLWITVLFMKVLKSKDYCLLGFFISLFMFMQFHYVFRQPIFWFLQGSLYVLASQKDKPAVLKTSCYNRKDLCVA